MEAKGRFTTNKCGGIFKRRQVKPLLTTQIQSDVGISGNENEDASSRNSLNTCDNGASCGVCKSWRSFSLANRCKFIASKSPMFARISTYLCEKKSDCYLEDLEGRKFKTSVPYFGDFADTIPYCIVGSTCIGSTCGYLILYGNGKSDLCLVNPITRHKLHIPDCPFGPKLMGAVVVFSCSISRWVFVFVTLHYRPATNKLYLSIDGEGTWKHVSSTFSIIDLEAFNGRIYTLDNECRLSELRLDPEPKLILLETKNFPISNKLHRLVSSCKNLYLREYLSEDSYKFHKLAFDEMNWVPCEKVSEECAFIHSTLKHNVARTYPNGKVRAFVHSTLNHSVALKHPKGKLVMSWYIPMIV